MSKFTLRPMQRDEWDIVATLICDGTNAWYESHGMNPIFSCGSTAVELFCQVYETLDPGCCILAVSEDGTIAGSCFYHPRSTHVSLGIMNVSPHFFGQGIARRLLKFVTDFAQQQRLPVRLVSSALNLDSFSLYSRAGFVPLTAYQDMFVKVPEIGLKVERDSRVRDAVIDDVEKMVVLEMEISGISREKDFRFFINNEQQIWHVSVLDNGDGIDGFLVSVNHPASTMLGPGVMKTEDQAVQLITAQLNKHKGAQPVFLIPVIYSTLVQTMYGIGAKNCEIHFSQSLGPATLPSGVTMPTFMPETG